MNYHQLFPRTHFLSSSHSIFGLPTTDKEGAEGGVGSFVAYPGIAFLPVDISSSEESLLEWLHDLWHELRHLEDIFITRFGMYQQTIFEIAEALGIYGLVLIAQRKVDEAKRYLSLSLQLVEKGIYIHRECNVAMEVMPTYSLIGPEVRHDTASLISYLGSKFKVTKSLTLPIIEKYVDDEGKFLLNLMNNSSMRSLLKIRPEYESAFIRAQQILRTYHEAGYLFAVPFLAMDIDLSG